MAPEEEVAPAQPLPPPPAGGWTGPAKANTVIGLLVLLFTAVLAYPTLQSLLSGVKPSTLIPSLAALVALVALGAFTALGGPARLRLWWRRRRKPEVTTVNPDRMTELQVLVDKAKGVWTVSSSFGYGFHMVSLNIMNSLNQAPNPPHDVKAEQRQAADRANYLSYGWRSSDAAADAVFWEIDRLVGDVRTSDPNTFVAILFMLRQVVLGGISLANSFAQEVRRSDPLAVPDHLRQEWTAFREKANGLSDQLNMLGEKTKREYEIGEISFYFPPVQDIRP